MRRDETGTQDGSQWETEEEGEGEEEEEEGMGGWDICNLFMLT